MSTKIKSSNLDSDLQITGTFTANNFIGSVSGSATSLETPRTLTIGSTSKQFDGTADVAWSLSEIGIDSDLSSSSTDDLSEGTTNLYYTDSRARNALSASGDLNYDFATGVFSYTERTDSEVRGLFSASGDLNYTPSTGEFSITTYKSTDFDTDFSGKNTDDLSEGSSNLYYTDTRSRNALSASGDLSYNSTTGTISFTERTDSEVRNLLSASGDLIYNSATGEFSVIVPTGYDSSDFDTDFSGKDTDDLSEGTGNLYYTDARVDSHLSGGTGVSYTSGTISIGQSVGTSDNVEFNDVVVGGNLTVGGTVDGRDVAADGSKLDGIEANADVTDTANVTAAGALMGSEVTNLAAVKAFDPNAYVDQTSTTGAAEIPAGTLAQRDQTPSAGYFRFNIESEQFEGYNGTSWGSVGGGGATGGGGDQVFIENDQVVNNNYTITVGRNAMSTGPITVEDGVVITIPDGVRWVVI